MEQEEHEIEATDSADLTDVILPSQFFGALGASGLCNERRLMLAVLVDAINILQRWNKIGRARERRTFADAAQWVLMQGTNYPFSFDNVCDALNIDPQMLRQRLRGLASHRSPRCRHPARQRVEPCSENDGNPCEPTSFELFCKLDSRLTDECTWHAQTQVRSVRGTGLKV